MCRSLGRRQKVWMRTMFALRGCISDGSVQLILRPGVSVPSGGSKTGSRWLFKQREPEQHAGLAHLVEQRYRKPQVVGSSPTAGSSNRNREDGFCLYISICAIMFSPLGAIRAARSEVPEVSL